MAYKQILLCVTFLFLMVGTAKADLYEDAVEAYNKGEYKRAALLFEMLAEKGDPRSQTFLGVIYGNGLGVNKNYVNAAKWYSLAAEQGSLLAQAELGRMFMEGDGVPQNFKIGLRYLLQAAEAGFTTAMVYLSFVYFGIEGTPKDYLRAYMWNSVALLTHKIHESRGAKGASVKEYAVMIKTRDTLVGMLSLDQLDKAQQLVVECLQSRLKNC